MSQSKEVFDAFTRPDNRPSHSLTFSRIYQNNAWKGPESVSGPSSGMERTATLRKALPEIISKHGIKVFLDAPCGDFYWMKQVAPELDIQYVGGDIVPELIASNKKNFVLKNIKFQVFDLTKDKFPTSDVLFCRDCLFHLSYYDIALVFANLLKSECRMLMTTSHITEDDFKNSDIQTGEWRFFDLLKPPFNLPAEALETVIDGGGDRYMYLWDIKDIASQLSAFIYSQIACRSAMSSQG